MITSIICSERLFKMSSIRKNGQRHGKALEYGLEAGTPLILYPRSNAVYDGYLPKRKNEKEHHVEVCVKNTQEQTSIYFGDLRRIVTSRRPELVMVAWHPEDIAMPTAMDILYLNQGWTPLFTKAQQEGIVRDIETVLKTYKDHPDFYYHRFDSEWQVILNGFNDRFNDLMGENCPIRPTWKRGHFDYDDGQMKRKPDKQFRCQCFISKPQWKKICSEHRDDYCHLEFRGNYLSPDDQEKLGSLMYGYSRDSEFSYLRQTHTFHMGTTVADGNLPLVIESSKEPNLDLVPTTPAEALRQKRRIIVSRNGKSHHPQCRCVQGKPKVYSFSLHEGAPLGCLPQECHFCKEMDW